MGIAKRLRLLGRAGTPSVAPLCPNEHDIESLERIVKNNQTLKRAYQGGQLAARITGAALPNLEDVQNHTLLVAMQKHNEACWPNQKSYCACDWCESNRRRLNGND